MARHGFSHSAARSRRPDDRAPNVSYAPYVADPKHVQSKSACQEHQREHLEVELSELMADQGGRREAATTTMPG
jgi:hypothetical protein